MCGVMMSSPKFQKVLMHLLHIGECSWWLLPGGCLCMVLGELGAWAWGLVQAWYKQVTFLFSLVAFPHLGLSSFSCCTLQASCSLCGSHQ